MRAMRINTKKKECVNAPVGQFAIFLHCTNGYNIRNELVCTRRDEMHRRSSASEGRFGIAEPEGCASICEGAENQYDDIGNHSTNSGISDLFSGIRFCKTCFLEIRGCFLGSSDILRHRLEEGSGCHVTLYPYPVDMDGVMRDAEDMGDEFHFPRIEWIIGLFF